MSPNRQALRGLKARPAFQVCTSEAELWAIDSWVKSIRKPGARSNDRGTRIRELALAEALKAGFRVEDWPGPLPARTLAPASKRKPRRSQKSRR